METQQTAHPSTTCEPMGADLGPGASFAPDDKPVDLEPDTGVVTMERGTLRAMLEGVTVTMSKDGTRPHLNGVLFEFGRDRLTLVSTDGHRLTKTEAPYHLNAPKGPIEPWSALIKADDVDRLLKAVKGAANKQLDPIELVRGTGDANKRENHR